MAKLLDKIVVVDLEATCWQGLPPPGEKSEIIEVGLCLLDVKTGWREPKRSIIVRPEQSEVSDFCTRLTTITPEMVRGGRSLGEAVALLMKEYRTRDRTWASYGDFDRLLFWRQCAEQGVPYPFGMTHLNAKNLFALAHGLQQEVSLAEAMAIKGWKMEGTYHRGDDDAWNIACLLGDLLKRPQKEL